jgi:uncharacterized protein (DUF433 family)
MEAPQSHNGKQFQRSIDVGQYLIASRGKLLFKGSRVSVSTVLGLLAKGHTFKQILARWPALKRKAIGEAVLLAAAALVLQSGARPWRTDDPALSTLLIGGSVPHTKPDKRKKPVVAGKYLIVHQNVCFGRLTFNPTRVPVEIPLAYLAMGRTMQRIRRGWPQLKREAIVEAIELATAALMERFAARLEAPDEPTNPG